MTTRTRPHSRRSALHRYWEQHKILHERRRLLDRPWLEDVLHWGPDGELHGEVAPSGTAGPSSVTSEGWCPGQR
jgi:hypothetical protein